MPLKLTSWNIKDSTDLIGTNLSAVDIDRRNRVRNTIVEIDPDILCMIEGPKGESAVTSFANDVLAGNWVPILLQGSNDQLGARDDDYLVKGSQWIWFLVKADLAAQCRLQEPAVWREYVGAKTWKVHYWGDLRPSRHSHYRHPQVLIVETDQGEELEIVGLHLKSKINRKPITRDQQGNIVGAYLEVALKARVKLASEARDVRAYFNKRFDQNPDPAIIVMGDVNDGVGQDYFESLYLFFDLISNLQGNVMNAERFLNHALFDFPGDLRWSAKYPDKIKKLSARENPLLIDHILMTQALVRDRFPLRANARAGSVEHEAFDRGNVGASAKRRTSDHRPVSVVLSDQA